MNAKYFKKTICPLCKSNKFSVVFTKREVYPCVQKKPISFTVVQCDICGLKYMNPILNNLGLKKVYNKEYMEDITISKRDIMIKDMQFYSMNKKMEYLIKRTRLTKGKLLDFGCGAGEFVKEYNKNFRKWSSYGFDFNDNLLTNDKIHYGTSILKTSLPKNSFDVVIMIEVAEHLIDPDKTFDEISMYLKKGGYIYIETGNNDSLISKIKKEKHFYFQIYHTLYFSRKTIKKILEKKGYKIIEINDDLLNGDIYMFKKNHNPLHLIRGVAYWLLKKIKLGNFSVTGGMSVLAQKIK